MPRRQRPIQKRGKYLSTRDSDRSSTYGQRHYANIQRMRHPAFAAPRPASEAIPVPMPPEIIEFPPPPIERYYVVLWMQKRLEDIRLRDLQQHLKRRLYIISNDGCMILVENMRQETFPRFHFPNNRYTITEYTATLLPIHPIPAPFT